MTKKDIAKILITGPFNSGKTTLIQFVSDEQLTSNDVETTDELAQYKAMTTVGLDFGVLHVDDELDVHLFGTPGQARFNFMWKTLSKGALGTVLLVDSSNQDAIDEAKKMFQFYCEISDMPIIICATKQDLAHSKSMQYIASELSIDVAHITSCNPSIKEDSKNVIIALLEKIIENETLLKKSMF